MKTLLKISVLLITLHCFGQVNVSSTLTIYDNSTIEKVERILSINIDERDLTIISKGSEVTDYDTYLITSRESIKKDNQYLYTLFHCVKPDNSHPTTFKFNYVDSYLDNVQVITKKDTIARMLIDE